MRQTDIELSHSTAVWRIHRFVWILYVTANLEEEKTQLHTGLPIVGKMSLPHNSLKLVQSL